MDIKYTCLQIIQYASEARCNYTQALQDAKCGDYELSEEYMYKGNSALRNAYCAYRDLVRLEANKKVKLSFLFIHAQDQVASVEIFKVLSYEFIELYHAIEDME